jgi:hypothetical protein
MVGPAPMWPGRRFPGLGSEGNDSENGEKGREKTRVGHPGILARL